MIEQFFTSIRDSLLGLLWLTYSLEEKINESSSPTISDLEASCLIGAIDEEAKRTSETSPSVVTQYLSLIKASIREGLPRNEFLQVLNNVKKELSPWITKIQ